MLLVACGVTDSAPVDRSASTLSQGADLYQANCMVCHGSDLRGTDLGPPFLSEVYRPNHHADAAFLLAVQTGSRAHHWNFGDMPPIAGIDADDIASITAYVRSVQEAEGFEPYPPP
ncbi:MAG: cytochrome c [Acidimicrobiia bacterium]|nr:cytochrome c [Acidimicrobiia bacterium]